MLQRSELELTYLRHQLRQLRRAYEGVLQSDMEPVATNGFYDDWRLMVHAPELERVHELLYPRDVKEITIMPLKLSGAAGLASLWADKGKSSSKRIWFTALRRDFEARRVASWLSSMGYGPAAEMIGTPSNVVRIPPEFREKLARDLYATAHPTMRKGLLTGTR